MRNEPFLQFTVPIFTLQSGYGVESLAPGNTDVTTNKIFIAMKKKERKKENREGAV